MSQVTNKPKYGTLEQERELIKAAQAGSKEAIQGLIDMHDRLIWKTVHKYRDRGYELEELYQVAVMSYIRCIQDFDLSLNYRLNTYAIKTVFGNLGRYIRDTPRVGAVKPPRSVLETYSKVIKHDLEDKSPEEVNRVLGLKDLDLATRTMELIHNGKGTALSTDAPYSSESEGDAPDTLGDFLVGDLNGENWQDYVELRDMISRLDDKAQELLRLRYEEELTQMEVAKRLNTHQSHIARLERKVIKRLRALYGLQVS